MKSAFPFSRHELKPDQVLSLFQKSDAGDWIYSEEQDVHSFRSNLLVQLVPAEKPGTYNLIYGEYVVANIAPLQVGATGRAHGRTFGVPDAGLLLHGLISSQA